MRETPEPNEQYAYFTVVGEFDPEEISLLTGVSPTKAWKKGDINPRSRYEHKFSRWSLYSRLDKESSLEDHMSDVFEQLESKRPEFAELSLRHNCSLQLVGYFKSFYPGFGLDRKLVKSLADYNLALDCDFYYLYSHKREDT
jgi:hypothetical protein